MLVEVDRKDKECWRNNALKFDVGRGKPCQNADRLCKHGLSLNGDSYARIFKCLAVFQAGVILHHKASWELEFNNVAFAITATISM